MSTATVTLPIAAAPSAAGRPGLGRLTRVELRKTLDTRAGFWLQVATVGLTVVAVIIRLAVGNPHDHTFRSVLEVGLAPASVLLAVVGILLVTSEWSQRTGLITFALVPVRSRVLAAKLLASLVLAIAAVVVCLAIVAVGVLLAAPGVDGTWSGAAAMVGQSALYVTASIVTGVAFGAILLASAPAIVANFALPTAWAALATIPVFASVAPWMDPSFDGMSGNVLSSTQWAHAARRSPSGRSFRSCSAPGESPGGRSRRDRSPAPHAAHPTLDVMPATRRTQEGPHDATLLLAGPSGLSREASARR